MHFELRSFSIVLLFCFFFFLFFFFFVSLFRQKLVNLLLKQMGRLKRIVGRCSKKLHLFSEWQRCCCLTFLDLLSFRPESVIPSAGEVNLSMLSLLVSAR